MRWVFFYKIEIIFLLEFVSVLICTFLFVHQKQLSNIIGYLLGNNRADVRSMLTLCFIAVSNPKRRPRNDLGRSITKPLSVSDVSSRRFYKDLRGCAMRSEFEFEYGKRKKNE